MADSRTSQFIERIPVGPLALMPLQSIAPLGKKVNDYLVSWRTRGFLVSEREKPRERFWRRFAVWIFIYWWM